MAAIEEGQPGTDETGVDASMVVEGAFASVSPGAHAPSTRKVASIGRMVAARSPEERVAVIAAHPRLGASPLQGAAVGRVKCKSERMKMLDLDGLPVYRATPKGSPLGGIILIHEIWGLVPHIKDVADRFAAAGYTVLAP